MAVAVETRYLYKVSRGTRYLGALPNVVSEFSYQQNIATAGAQLKIKIGITADTANLSVEAIEDELGNPITAEDGSTLTTERVADVVGDTNANNMIRNDNTIEVVEFSANYPLGKTVFKGYVAKWRVVFGGTDDIEMTVISNGQDLSQYLVESGDSAYISQTLDSGMYNQFGLYSDKGGWYSAVVQTFTMPVTKTVDAISIEVTTTMATSVSLIVRRMTGSSPDLNSDPEVARGSYYVGSAVSATVIKVAFDYSVDLATGITYYFELLSYDLNATYAHGSNANPYANGSLWLVDYSGTYWGSATQYSGYDCYFIIWQYGGSVNATYTSKDPTYMLTDILSNYTSRGGIITIPPSPVTPILSQPIADTLQSGAYWSAGFAQVITPVVDTTINLVQLQLGVSSGTTYVGVDIYKGNPSADTVTVISGGGQYDNVGASVLQTGSNTLPITNTTIATTTFTLNSTVTLLAGQTYYVRLFFLQGGFGNLLMKSAGLADLPITATGIGKLYSGLATFNNATFNMTYSTANPALAIGLAYANPVPSILTAGYANTGVTTTYTFKVQTILEAIQVIASLAPYNWYWYVDPSDNVLYFKVTSTTAEHTMIKGRHINQLVIEATKENIANVVYFTGGPTAGVNTFVKTTDSASLLANRVGLAKLSDNRVVDNATATTLNTNYINAHNAETYITDITVLASAYDISTFKLGQVIGFGSFGTFVDRMLLQIVGIQRDVDQVILSLGTLPKRSSAQVEKINRDLALQQTLSNPSTPS